ncbi:MAG: nuclear transport factor 2 family protein [Pseudomonadota bacterium]
MRRAVPFLAGITTVLLLAGCAPVKGMSNPDRQAIADQVTEYGRLWDLKDADGVSRLFTEDGVMEWHLAGAQQQPPLAKGRAAIAQYSRQAHEVRLAGRQSRHHFSGLVFHELSETEALTEHVFMVTHVIPGEPPVLVASGLYRINWQKTGEAWLMTHRKLHVDR